MRVIETCLKGLVALEPALHGHQRGSFVESYRHRGHIVSEREAQAPRLAAIADELPFRWHP